MFETGTIDCENDMYIRTKDIEEMTGHFRMFNQTLQALDEPLSIDIIKQMHYNLKVGVFEDMANGYPCGEFILANVMNCQRYRPYMPASANKSGKYLCSRV